MWSSWYLCGTPSNRILIDSSASTIQAYLVLCSQYCGRFPRCNFLVFYKALLLASELPTFYERFSWCVWILHLLVQWRRYHVIVWHDRALVSRQPTFVSLCFSLHQKYASTYLAIHCRVFEVVCFLVSVHPDHEHPSGGLSFKKKSCEACPCIW